MESWVVEVIQVSRRLSFVGLSRRVSGGQGCRYGCAGVVSVSMTGVECSGTDGMGVRTSWFGGSGAGPDIRLDRRCVEVSGLTSDGDVNWRWLSAWPSMGELQGTCVWGLDEVDVGCEVGERLWCDSYRVSARGASGLGSSVVEGWIRLDLTSQVAAVLGCPFQCTM